MRLKSYAAQTHQGPYLQVNEDGYDFDFENELYMIFDGFGGAGIGDRAVEKLKDDIKTYYIKISDDLNATMPLYYNPRNILEGNAILNSLISANEKLVSKNNERSIGQRAGASTIVAVKAEGLMILVGVGNCCAYHFRQGKLTKIIHEDSFKFHSKDKFDSKLNTTPLTAIGMYDDLGFQVREVKLSDGDKIILLTDGVYVHISEEELLYHLNKSVTDGGERINSLLKLSNSRGNTDNQTAMILEF
jgi:serine/threonine protein phosphatase PrpC